MAAPDIILYQTDEDASAAIEGWLRHRFSDHNHRIFKERNLQDLKSTLPHPDSPGALLVTPAQLSLSRGMNDYLAERGITHLCNCEELYSLYHPTHFALRHASKKTVVLVDDDEARFRRMEAILAPFGLSVLNPPLKGGRDIRSWTHIPGWKGYKYDLWGGRPIIIVNLDMAGLSLKPFLHSLDNEMHLPGQEQALIKPYLLPFKDFDQGSLWDEIQSGIRRHARAILAYPELLELVFRLAYYQETSGLEADFDRLAGTARAAHWDRGSWAERLNHPETFVRLAQLRKDMSRKTRAVAKWSTEVQRMLFFRLSLAWHWRDGPALSRENDPKLAEKKALTFRSEP